MHFQEQTRLLESLRSLDSQAVGAVYDRYFPGVFRYVLYRVGDRQTAEDIASDVFLRLLEAVRSDRGPRTNLPAWLNATASHAVSDHHRRTYRRPTLDLPETLAETGPGLQAEFDSRERDHLVRHAYSQLTADQQAVLALRFGQGCSVEETASLLKKNINAVKSLQFRALAAIQRQISRGSSDEVD